jgi:hypothetical protein
MAALKQLLLRVVCLGCAALLTAVPVRAQTTPGTLQLLEVAEGEVQAGLPQSWTFSAVDTQMLSFVVQATSGDLDPVVEIATSAGNTLILDDDAAYPTDTSAVLEGITLPRADTYTLTVRGYGGTTGGYTVLMLPGLGTLSGDDSFSGGAQWRSLTEGLEPVLTGGRLALSLEGSRLMGIVIQPGETESATEYYAQVDVQVDEANSGWIAGFAARVRDDGSYYLLKIKSSGEWQFVMHTPEGETILRDWTPHPAIVPDTRVFRLGMLVNDANFDFFYDGKLIGKVTDDMLPLGGRIGLGLETSLALTSRVGVSFDDLVVTTPVWVNGDRLIPSQLMTGTPLIQAQELQRRGLIPAGGEMALTVTDSSVELRSPGVNRLGLGRGLTFSNLAMGATMTWQAAFGGQTGCGLVARAQDDSDYTLVYVDQTGAFGASRRQGESFAQGIYGETPDFTGDSRHLLLIVRGDTLLLYVDGRYVGQMPDLMRDGSVGNAVINFEPISTTCQFKDTWVWNWLGS